MEGRKMIDYIEIMQEYYAGRNDGFLTDRPVGIKLAEDDYVRVRYDSEIAGGARALPDKLYFNVH